MNLHFDSSVFTIPDQLTLVASEEILIGMQAGLNMLNVLSICSIS